MTSFPFVTLESYTHTAQNSQKDFVSQYNDTHLDTGDSRVNLESAIQTAADLLRSARRLTVLTGAGVSRESGVPTFRDAMEGLWAQYDPKQLATMPAFRKNPQLVWDFYQFRRGIIANAKPNPGHFALAALEKRFGAYPLITQNIDSLHEQAGSTNVIHLHGEIDRNKCVDNCQGDPTLIEVSTLPDHEASPPKCPHCGSYVRPDVVWFGEQLPSRELRAADEALTCDVILVVGTSGVVAPAAMMPHIARNRGAVLIEVNPNESELTDSTAVWIAAPSGEALPRVLARLEDNA